MGKTTMNEWFDYIVTNGVKNWEYHTIDYVYCVSIVYGVETELVSLHEVGEATIDGVVYPHRRVLLEEEQFDIHYGNVIASTIIDYQRIAEGRIRKRKISKLLKVL